MIWKIYIYKGIIQEKKEKEGNRKGMRKDGRRMRSRKI